MTLPPGLLPDSNETKPSRPPVVLGAVVLLALISISALLVQNRRLAGERDKAREKLVAARRALTLAPPAAAPPSPLQAAPPPAAPAEPVSASATAPRAPALRMLPARADDPDYLARGLQEFRAGRYDQAERQFFRAFPDSLLYLALSSLAQRSWGEAFSFLARAISADPNWLRKVNPRDLFGKDSDYAGLLQDLDDQIARNPIDADLKTLAAYLRFHDKGAPYAKALLIEATAAKPDHEAARAFLEALGP